MGSGYMPEELCQVSPKPHYVSLASHSDPNPLAYFELLFNFSHLNSQRFGVSHQSPLWYLISAGNLFQIRRLQFPFHCCHQTTTGIGENVAKNLNRILSISQIAFLARRNLNWKRTFIYISNKRNATPAQYINTTFVPTGLTSKNYFFQ